MWEDYSLKNPTLCNVKRLHLSDADAPEDIVSYNITEGSLMTITLTITNNSLYWYEQNKESENALSLCKCDLKTGKQSVEKSGITLSSPFEKVNFINNYFVTYESSSDDKTTIHINNTNNSTNNSKKALDIKVSDSIRGPISNGEFCVWMKGYDALDNVSLFIYDISKQTCERIQGSYIFSYGIIDNMIITNQLDGLYCYDMKNKEYAKLVETDQISYGYTAQGQENNVFTQDYEDGFNLLNLTYKDLE